MANESSTIPVLHVLPCKIDHVGPAAVAAYFDSTRSTTGHERKIETASFRGRPLIGSEIALRENGYRLYEATVDPSDHESESAAPNFHITKEVERLIYWNLDKPTSSTTDALPRLMHYLAAAKAFVSEAK